MHVADGLDTNALIDIDIAHPENWILNISNEMAEPTHNMKLKDKLEVVAGGERFWRW